jgi:hypothetical protein
MVIIIHSIDETTEFLSSISKELIACFENSVKCFKINSDLLNDDIYRYIESIEDNSIILFLGHGGSSYLCRENRSKFVTKEHLKLFNGKSLFCLSCRSQEFLESNFKFNSIKNAIGFGDLPTDWNDISGARENDSNAYKDVNENIISEYRLILVELIVKSFTDFFKRSLDFEGIYNYFNLHLNKKISEVILRDKSQTDNRILSDLLYEIKLEMKKF